jgi:hypothetical protein
MATYTVESCEHRLWGAHVTSEAVVFSIKDSTGAKVLQYLIPIECFTQMSDGMVNGALRRAMRDYEAGFPAPVFKNAIANRCATFVNNEYTVNP